jgi:metal-responsive CopG/Arc/MetJ family transcriptional regulator
MNQAIGIRLDNDFIKKVDILSKEEVTDRSSIIRKLIVIGYKNLIKNKLAQKYKEGKITISEAANKAEITIWEMEQYLVEQGFKSSYSIEDLKNEISTH